MARNADSGRRHPAVDPRLLIGIGLVAASVVGVVALVTAADSRVTVFAAAATLVPGDSIDRDDLVERSVSLAGAEELYLRADDVPAAGLTVIAAVGEGELLPRTAVGDAAGLRSTALVVESAAAVSTSVGPGSSVEIWATPADPGRRATGTPAVLVEGAVVVRVLDDDALVSTSSGAAVEVRVPRSRVARVLQAQADGDILAIVPAGLPLER